MDKEIEKASVITEPFDSKSWRVQGKVFDRNKKPLKGVTVYISGKKKTWIKNTGKACTNDIGYYSLTLIERTVGTIVEQPLYLSVADKNKKIIYMSAEPVYVSKGFIVIEDIYINGMDSAPPPAVTGR